jgi:hypothetical protein
MNSIDHYVYVLRLANGGFYVGCTRNLPGRIAEHFEKGGAMATRESNPIAIEKIYRFKNCFFGKEPARLRLEVFIASQFADQHGIEKVRGAKHGRGWDTKPTRNDLRFIRRFRNFFSTAEGVKFLELVTEIDPQQWTSLTGIPAVASCMQSTMDTRIFSDYNNGRV